MRIDPAAGTVTYSLVELEQVRDLLSAASWKLIDERNAAGMNVALDYIIPALDALALDRASRKEPA